MQEGVDILDNIKRIHFIGIGGISMSGIAMMLKNLGYTITGSDISKNDMTDILLKAGIDVYIGSNTSYINSADMVVYTAAIPSTDTEYVKAVKLNKPLYERAKFIGHMLKIYNKPICIAGMHGKTTTTSMITSVFEVAKTQPTVLVGSKLKELNNLNYIIGEKNYFILEACEYVDSFLNFPGDTCVVLNIEAEHLDYFKNLENIKKSFGKFMCQTYAHGNLVVNHDDEIIVQTVNNNLEEIQKKNINITTFSIVDDKANIFASNIALADNCCYGFDVNYNGRVLGHITLNVPGKHNIYNSIATVAVALVNNISISDVVCGIDKYTGASRRFEFKKEINNAKVFDDYAHHPTEIKAVLKSAKEMTKGNVFAIFQPHTYSRLKTLFEQFTQAFYDANVVIITDIYAAREKDDGTISSLMLVEKLKENGVNATYIKEFADIAEYIKANVKANDVVLTIGAGTITNLSDFL